MAMLGILRGSRRGYISPCIDGLFDSEFNGLVGRLLPRVDIDREP
jgi:hypothetical protein